METVQDFQWTVKTSLEPWFPVHAETLGAVLCAFDGLHRTLLSRDKINDLGLNGFKLGLDIGNTIYCGDGFEYLSF